MCLALYRSSPARPNRRSFHRLSRSIYLKIAFVNTLAKKYFIDTGLDSRRTCDTIGSILQEVVMYKYTPKEQILKEIQRAFGEQKKNLMYDLQSKLNEIFKKFHCKPPFCSFSISKYCNAVYYSKFKLQHERWEDSDDVGR